MINEIFMYLGLPAKECKEFNPPFDNKKSDTPTTNDVDKRSNNNPEMVKMKNEIMETCQTFRNN